MQLLEFYEYVRYKDDSSPNRSCPSTPSSAYHRAFEDALPLSARVFDSSSVGAH
jgi:hypothetical protein